MDVQTTPNNVSYRTNLLWKVVDREALLIDPVTGHFFALNETGTIVWTALLRGETREEAARMVSERFQVSELDAKRDLDSLINELREAHLLDEL